MWGISLWFGAYWLLKKTVDYVRRNPRDSDEGHLYAIGFLISSLVSTICIHQLMSRSASLGLRVISYYSVFSYSTDNV